MVTNKRFYSPQFSGLASISVRRLAWATHKSMPATVDLLVRLLPSIIDPVVVCQACQDKTKCQACTFSHQLSTEDKTALLAVF